MHDREGFCQPSQRDNEILFAKKLSPKSLKKNKTLRKKSAIRFLKKLSREHINQKQLAVFAFDVIGIHISVEGIYEKAELDLLFEWLSKHHKLFKSSAALDIGANIGNHSLYFSDYFSKVFSFEPNGRTFKLLSLNSELANNVECFNFGLSNKAEAAFLHTPYNDIGRSSIKNIVNPSDIWQKSKIILKRFDDIFNSDLQISLIKIDVEGHEYEVMAGAERSIKNNKPLIIFEQHSDDFYNGTSRCIELLESYGYKEFASIDLKHRSDRKYPKILQNLINWILPRFIGTSYQITVHSRFEHRLHNFIIAIPDWVKSPRFK